MLEFMEVVAHIDCMPMAAGIDFAVLALAASFWLPVYLLFVLTTIDAGRTVRDIFPVSGRGQIFPTRRSMRRLIE